MASVGKLIVELEAKGVKLTKAQLKQLEGQGKKTGMSLKAMAVSLGASTVAMFAMQRAIMGSISVGKEFEQSMANVKAISGATGIEFRKLESSAKQLGASTKFTASQVAGLQTEYAKLGFSTKEILGAQSATLALAAATGAELPRASEVAGATLRGFGIDAQDTSRVTDVMALSFSRSALDMERFAESMKFVAPVAKSAGFSVEGTTAILAKMADVGIHGSLAGTALKNIFGDLAGESSKLSKRLGGPTANMEELAPKLQQLKAEGFGLTEALDLVGRRSAPAFLALVEGSDDLMSLTEQFNQAGGAAQRMADVQLDTLQGKLTILNSATEGLGIAFFDTFDDALGGAVTNLTSFVSAITGAIETPMSTTLNEDRLAMNGLFNILQDTNTSTEDRKRAIDALNTEYETYLPNALTEKTSLEDIAKAQKESNDALFANIMIRAKEEELTKVTNDYNNTILKRFDAMGNLASLEQKRAEFIEKSGKTEKQLNDELAESAKRANDSFQGRDNQMSKEIQNYTALNAEIGMQQIKVNDLNEDYLEFTNELDRVSLAYQAVNEEFANFTKKSEEVKEGGGVNNAITGGKGVNDAVEELTAYQELIKNFTTTYDALNEITEENVANNIKLGQSYAEAGRATQAMGNAAVASALESANASITSAVTTWIVNYMKTTPLPAIISGPLALAGGAAFGAGITSLVQGVPKFAKGGDYITDGPEMIMVGDNPGGQERVQVTPLSSPNIDGPQGGGVTINISGNVMSQDYVEGELAESIKEAVRKGSDFGMASYSDLGKVL
jgi:TP901 family phage tail tape measure protein